MEYFIGMLLGTLITWLVSKVMDRKEAQIYDKQVELQNKLCFREGFRAGQLWAAQPDDCSIEEKYNQFKQ